MSAKVKFAPGPWAATPFEIIPGSWEVRSNTGWGREPLCVHLFPDVDAAEPQPHVGATAKLIAASPDLFAACELWDQGFEEGEQFDPLQFLAWANANRRAARAAIAKALTGGTT